MDQANFFGKLYQALVEIIDVYIHKNETQVYVSSANPEEENCESMFFEKIKFAKSTEGFL